MSTDRPTNDAKYPRLTRYIWGAVSFVGAVLSFFINLYSDNVRSWVDWTWAQSSLPWVLYVIVLVASCYVVWTARGSMVQRRIEDRRIVAGTIRISVDDFIDDLPSNANVVGRDIRYLERITDSPYLVVFLHGLGLDANDFRPYMHVAREHTVAVTQFGFNIEEATDPRYRPIGLQAHAELLSSVINTMQRRYPTKSLVLVGFSLGADMLLRLGELWRDQPDQRPTVKACLLLDPNINHSTMFLSGVVSRMNPADPLAELKNIAATPATLPEFQNICEYLHKITVKDLNNVRQYARDAVDYWEPDGQYGLFMDRVNVLRATSASIRIVFSFHFEDHFNDVLAQARLRRMNTGFFAVESVDHFNLLDDVLLQTRIGELTGRTARRPSIGPVVPPQPILGRIPGRRSSR